MSSEQLPEKYFSQAKAQAKVGRQVRSLVEFSGVPNGTTGLVIRADQAASTQEVYDVAIQWDLSRPGPSADLVIPAAGEPYVHIRPGNPLVDWFTREEYERYLDEMPAGAGNPVVNGTSDIL